MPSVAESSTQSGLQDHKTALARLDEEKADLDFLQENLKKSNDLTQKMVSMLDTFDDRLVKLESSILPIHKSTQRLTHLSDNIDMTLKSMESLIKYFDLAAKEESYIQKGPDDSNLVPYLQSINRIKEALEYLSKARLRSCENVIGQLKKLLKTAMMQLENLFRKWLSANSKPLDVRSIQREDAEIPSPSTEALERLSSLTVYLSSSESETGYAPEYTKTYIEIRSAHITRTLEPLLRSTSNYASQTHCLLKLMQAEHRFASKIIKEQQTSYVFRGTIQPAFTTWLESGRDLLARSRRDLQREIFSVYDVLELLKKKKPEFEEMLRLAEMREDDMLEFVRDVRNTAMRSFAECMQEVKERNGRVLALPNDGTVSELTSNTVNYLKRILDYRPTVESLLEVIGDGAWNNPEGNELYLPDTRGPPGNEMLRHFCVDVMDALVTTLTTRSKSYKRPALAAIFLMNNFRHIVRQIRSCGLESLLEPTGCVERYERMTKKQMDAYQDTWNPILENLMDVTPVRGGGLRSNDKQSVKERFKNFNTDFEELHRTQRAYAIPDTELRQQVIADVRRVIMPLYTRFLDRHQQTEFSKNPQKYIRYDRDQLDRLLYQLFDQS
ncbi:uncharacterized protein VTP21DRAFT_11397 [Calcarisporiella thermophila]|uniref:uncharacterized protein n=1 Tax=Calcarisporiella thermophila TaxID=911321 RepID=UPI00374357A7